MKDTTRSRSRRAGPPALGLVIMLCTLAGCQSYERAPLDLTKHRAAFDTRIENIEGIERFAERLSHQGDAVPDRFDPTDGLTRAEGEVLALFYNADLRIARLNAGVARATFETAGLWEDPRFGFDGAEILSPSGPFQYGLTLSLTIPVSGRLGVEKDRAGAAYETELRRIVDAEWRTRALVRSAWGAWSIESERLRLLREIVGQVERVATISDRLESAGELTRVEARLLRMELVEVRADIAQAEFDEAAARINLLGILGLPPEGAVELVPAFVDGIVQSVDATLDRLIRTNTLLAVRRAEYRVAEETLRLEIREQYPDITFGAGYGSEENDDRLLLGLSVPIPVLNANRAGIAEARARRDVARVVAETTFERLSQELAMARASLDAARAQRGAFERDLVPMLDEQSSEVERLADLGEVNTLLLLETVTRGFEAKDRLLDLRLAELRAANEITRLLGPETPRSPARVDSQTDTAHSPSADDDSAEPTEKDEASR